MLATKTGRPRTIAELRFRTKPALEFVTPYRRSGGQYSCQTLRADCGVVPLVLIDPRVQLISSSGVHDFYPDIADLPQPEKAQDEEDDDDGADDVNDAVHDFSFAG
jgi:hypothetical protein